MTPLLVALGGYAKAGKDTIAAILDTQPDFKRDYMSRPLEEALLTLNPWCDVSYENWVPQTYDVETFRYHQWLPYQDLHHMLGYDESKNCLDVRRYLQVLGTEIGRKMFGENVWVDRAFAAVDEAMAQGYSVALTGIRFPNELDAVKERGGIAVWVKRPGYGPVNGHASDNTLSEEDFTVVINNAWTVQDLAEYVLGRWLPNLERQCQAA